MQLTAGHHVLSYTCAISAIWCFATAADMLHYSITKQMQIGLGHGLAQLTKGTGVTVNTVLPGRQASITAADILLVMMPQTYVLCWLLALLQPQLHHLKHSLNAFKQCTACQDLKTLEPTCRSHMD